MTNNQQLAAFFACFWGGGLATWLWIRWKLKIDDAQDRKVRSELLNRQPWPVEAKCWCEKCDVMANGWRTRMSLCPECGDKRCQRALIHTAACSKDANKCEVLDSELHRIEETANSLDRHCRCGRVGITAHQGRYFCEYCPPPLTHWMVFMKPNV